MASGKKTKLTEEQERDLAAAYGRREKSARAIRDELGIGEERLKRILAKFGIEYRNYNLAPVTPEILHQAIHLYEHKKMATVRIAKQLGVAKIELRRAMQKAGIVLSRSNFTRAPMPRMTEAIELYKSDRTRSVSEVAEIFGLCKNTLWKHLNALGIEIRRFPGGPRGRAKTRAKNASIKKQVSTEHRPITYFVHDKVAPTDPDAKVLMRRFAPVCRAQVVDPNAGTDEWIVGRLRVSEERMRAMARSAVRP